MPSKSSPLRSLPAVEALLRSPVLAASLDVLPRPLVVEAVRAELAEERARLKSARGNGKAPPADEIAARAAARAARAQRPSLRRVLNATGIVLHTNLGRAPLSEPARRAVADVAAGYSTLEFDLDSGARGDRGLGPQRWLTRLTGAEAALAVNNNAAALLLTLSALASGRPVAVSRGELVEIGGSFRIPEILEKSGARLVEVGTTNRTHLRDYQRALERHEDLALVLRVHPSNFRIDGFTARPTTRELARLAHRHRVPLVEDLGSGALVDLESMGLEHEPTVRESLNAGVDLVTFSGDKLLGGTQAGLIVGRRRLLERVRRDPLARALRLDKLALAALEATLAAYSDPARAVREIPALAMLTEDPAALKGRAESLARELEARVPGLEARVEPGQGEVGGGSLPAQRLQGWTVALAHPGRTADELDRWARGAEPPVIGYLRGGRLRLDVRTLTEGDARDLVEALGRARWP